MSNDNGENMLKRRRRLITYLGLAAVLSAAAMAACILRRPGPPYKFLPRQDPLVFNPGMPGIIGLAYSWRENYADVVARADRELLPLKLQRQVLKNGEGILYSQPPSPVPMGPSIDILRGRLTGKHFHIDGDYLDSEPDPGWVTVEVIQRDMVPSWLRILFPL